MSAADRMKVLLFLALFSGASGALFTLLCCGTEYWLLAAESCRSCWGLWSRSFCLCQPEDGVTMFHQGLFWRCFFTAASSDFSVLDFWITSRPESKTCQPAFLFPFPAPHPAWTVFRTFWSIFLVSGVMAVVIGGLLVLCAAPLTNRSLYSAGGALQICGGMCLLVVMAMYLVWVQVLDTLEQFAAHQRSVSGCPSYQLSVQQGPSFLLAPAAGFLCLLAGLLFILVGRGVQGVRSDQTIPSPSETEL
uniref:Transmembrane protein 182 n=1 Tax=Poecilia mexicana TaxID=48701 RepID=A0A3B3YMY8_9TELE